MNEHNHNNNLMCNHNQMSKNLPLKKRRTYLIDPLLSNDEHNENYSKIIKPSYSQDNSFQLPIPIVPTPPSSPHIDLLRQQYAYLSSNSTNIQQQNYHYLMTQHYLDNYQILIDQQYDKQKRTDLIIDEHFQKSIGDNYNKLIGRCLTPDDSSSNSSSIERTSVDSIEEHFARSLAKFRPSNEVEKSLFYHQITEAVVDDHFAKALGSTTWENLKDKS